MTVRCDGETPNEFWSPERPYHVALDESYALAHHDEIAACCEINDVPFEWTGEVLKRDGKRWRTYCFARQLDGIRFREKFKGRWMRFQNFYPTVAPPGLVPMRSPNMTA